MMDTTFNLFEENFEIYVEKKLQEIGYKTLRSIYLRVGEYESQIDIMAFGYGNIVCIECKSMVMTKLQFGRKRVKWVYTDEDGKDHPMPSVLTQNYNHINTIKMYLQQENYLVSIKEEFGIPVPIIVNACIFKDSLELPNLSPSIRKANGVYRVKDLNLIQELNFVKDTEVDIRNKVGEKILSILEPFVDTSNKRKVQHGLYIRECKKNKLGYFRGLN